MDDRYKWLEQYARPCFNERMRSVQELPHIKIIEEFLEGDYSREKVRDYFFIPHNSRTFRDGNYVHLIIPYLILDVGDNGLTCVVNKPFYDKLPVFLCSSFFDIPKITKTRNLGGLREGEVLLFHFSEIVDCCSKKDLKKYDSLYTEL